MTKLKPDFQLVILPRRQSLRAFFQAAQPHYPSATHSDHWLLYLALAAFACGGLLLLTLGLNSGFFTLQQLSQQLPAVFWQHLTLLGDTLVVLSLALLLALRYPQLLLALIVSALLGMLITHGFKNLLATPRPAAVLSTDSFQQIGILITRNSMPSGHTLTAFAAAGLLTRTLHHSRLKGWVLVLALLAGWSRVAVGAHWPADVCMGAGGGLLAAWCGLKSSDWLQRYPLPPLLFAGLYGFLLLSAMLMLQHDGGMPDTHLFCFIIGVGCLLYSAVALRQHGLIPGVDLIRSRQ